MNLRSRLLTAFLFIGVLNLVLVSVLVYLQTRKTLIDRANQHLTSARSLTEQKLSLYFKGLKVELLNRTSKLDADSGLESVCETTPRGVKLRHGLGCPPWETIEAYPDATFIPYGKNSFLLKDKTFLWLFNTEGLTDLLQEREGLGTSGEIYLVGRDGLIKSASRFLAEWQHVEVKNRAVKNALKQQTGVEVVDDYRGIKVVSAYSDFRFERLEFVILSEIDWEEVTLPLQELLSNLLLIGSLIFGVSVLLALFLTRSTVGFVTRMEEEVSLLNSQSAINVLRAQEEERQRLAFNLHDSVGQSLTALKWELSRLHIESKEAWAKEQFSKVLEIADTLIQEIRIISQDIMPSMIKDFGCLAAIKDYCRQQQAVYPFSIECDYPEQIETLELKENFQINLYRMAQELIQNAAKHAHAKEIKISFSITPEDLIMAYEDDGKGMEAHAPLPHSLLYRAKLFRGRMSRSPKENGLNLRITFSLGDIA